MRKSTKRQATTAAAGLAAAVAGTMLATQPASAASVTSSFITSQPHSVQRACAERILAAQGPGAWTAWSGSLDDMMAESGNSDTAVNASSGAAGYFQIMPSTWADLCSDLGGSGSVSAAAVPSVSETTSAAAPVAEAAPVATQPQVAQSPDQGDYGFSSHVQAVQQLLMQQGYSVGSEGADGLLGPHTYAGICDFQGDHGLTVDGIPGANTWAALS